MPLSEVAVGELVTHLCEMAKRVPNNSIAVGTFITTIKGVISVVPQLEEPQIIAKFIKSIIAIGAE